MDTPTSSHRLSRTLVENKYFVAASANVASRKQMCVSVKKQTTNKKNNLNRSTKCKKKKSTYIYTHAHTNRVMAGERMLRGKWSSCSRGEVSLQFGKNYLLVVFLQILSELGVTWCRKDLTTFLRYTVQVYKRVYINTPRILARVSTYARGDM